MLTTAIRIDRAIELYIRRFVPGYDRLRAIYQDLGTQGHRLEIVFNPPVVKREGVVTPDPFVRVVSIGGVGYRASGRMFARQVSYCQVGWLHGGNDNVIGKNKSRTFLIYEKTNT